MRKMEIYKIALNNLTDKEYRLLELYLIELGYYYGDDDKTVEWVQKSDLKKIKQFVRNLDNATIEILDTRIVDFVKE